MNHPPPLPPIGHRGSAPLPQLQHHRASSTTTSTASVKPPSAASSAAAAAVSASLSAATVRPTSPPKLPTRFPRAVHRVIAAAISQTAVLSACIPHATVSHRLLEYLVPQFIPAKEGVDIAALGTTRASQLLGDLAVSASGFAKVVSHRTRFRGTLAITSPSHEDLRSLQRLCGSHLTSLQLHLGQYTFVPSRHRASSDRPSWNRPSLNRPSWGRPSWKDRPALNRPSALKEAQLFEKHAQALRESVAAFGQMRCLKHLTIFGRICDETFDVAVACAAAVLPRLDTLKMVVIAADFPCQSLFQLAVPNCLRTFIFGVKPPFRQSKLEIPSFAFWQFFQKLDRLVIINCSIGAEFLAGAAAALTSLRSLDLSTATLQRGCDESLAAFPEGLEELRYGNAGDVRAVAAYPHLTSVAVNHHDDEVLDFLHADGRNTTEAFERRARHRRDVREEAVRAALANLHLSHDLATAPPMVVDLSTGNKHIHRVSALQALAVGSLSAARLQSLGVKFSSLRRLKFDLGRVDHFIDLTSWCSLRYLHAIELTWAGASAASSLCLLAIVRQLSMLDPTLRELTLPECSVELLVAVASHLPQLAKLRIASGGIHTGITPTARRAALQRVGALRAGSSDYDDDEDYDDDYEDDAGDVDDGDDQADDMYDDGNDGVLTSPARSDIDGSRRSNGDDESYGGHSDSGDDGDPELDEVPMRVAVSVLGPCAFRPRPRPAFQPPRPPLMLSLRQHGAVYLDAAAADKLFEQPRLLHTLIFDAAHVEIDTVPGLALLFPKLRLLESWGLTFDARHPYGIAGVEECLRPYWPQITLRERPKFQGTSWWW